MPQLPSNNPLSNTTLKEAQLALSKVKSELLLRPDSVFFTHLAFSMNYEFDSKIETACTNGVRIKINPDFFMGLHPQSRTFLLLHEVMHGAYMHMLRRGKRDANRWNIAADYVINNHLIERGFRMPPLGLSDPQYSGMSTEKVYDSLPENTPPPSSGDRDIEEPGNEEDNTPPEEVTKEIEKALEDLVQQAALHSKAANDNPGTIPGDIQIFLDKLLNPKLPWQRILQKWLTQFTKNNYTFKRANRRFFPKHILPSLYGEQLCNLAIAIDTSGSVSDKEFLRFVSEIHSIFRMLKPEKITIIQFDRTIKSIKEVRSTRELMGIHFSGRGGTAITPVMEWAQDNKPQAMLVFTDGYFRIHPNTPKINNLVWLIHNNPTWKAPFGKVIHYETEIGNV